MQRLATALLILVVTASVAPVISAGASGEAVGEAYAGTHVSFEVGDGAVTDYAVHGETMLESVRVESQQTVEGGDPGPDGSLPAVTRIDGAGLYLDASTGTEARVAARNGATLTAHDNRRGVLVVASGNQTDYVAANLPAGTDASVESGSRVEVTTENGTEATLLVIGEGAVAVGDEGDVTAKLGEDSRLVFRAYPEGKTDTDAEQERLIARGEATAEAYVTVETTSDGGGENERTVVDAVTYDDDITVELAESEGEVASGTGVDGVVLAVNRTTNEGTILLVSVSETALNASGVTVAVDGEAAAEAATYSQLESAVGSEQSRYVAGTGAGTDASVEVAVAVNRFSTRRVSIASAGSDGE